MEHLLAFKSHAALIKLCETFPELDWPFETIVTRMAQTKDWMSAELLVKTFAEDDDTGRENIEGDLDIHSDQRVAHRLVVSFNLQKQYPDVDALYTRDGLMRLIEAQRWQLALTFVGHDTTLQKVLLEHMVTAGELAHAAHLVKMMVNAGLVPDISPMIPKYSDSGEIGQGVEDEGSNKVDDKQVVGLDVEWKPIIARSKATTAVASILQIASSDGVFVVDLLALHDNDLLFDSFLPRLLTSPQWLKLGFGFDSDLKVLHQTFPERQSFTGVSPFLDLNTLELTSGPINSGLSQCVHHVLGKPLDKTETPSVVCIEANYKLDMVQIARLRGVGRRKVRLAAASECRRVFGFAPGTVAPFGHKPWTSKSEDKSTHPVLINLFVDSRLQKAQYLAAGSGSPDKVIWVESKAFFALISIELLDDISIPRDSPTSVDNTDKTSGNIAETEPKPLEYKFLADSMVTQVGRWLRTIGVDVVTWNPEDVKATRSTDPKSVMLAFAATEDRIVLTRDTGLPSRRDAGACFVLSDDECYKQFREVKLQFGLVNHIGTRSSRCARCNSDTFSPINADSARKKMSERLRKKVPISVTTFWNCDGCGRVYWEGPSIHPRRTTVWSRVSLAESSTGLFQETRCR
ncbi:Carbonic anhydrase 2 [Phytophthora nicotianae]|uniref:Carbonic anhydrase 2 n=1 Tax=Phytophthora nicotianae TaxID=4792 RepID=A0A0W8D614_PHYNI|nr:Carbonic anhydrase 2 [Phytophthora nicotianae]